MSTEDIIQEVRNREIKSKNIMIFGVEETGHDEETVKEIMQEIDVNNANYVKVFRVGNVSGKRPLKVIFPNKNIVGKILKNKHKLKNNGRSVTVDTDITVRELKLVKSVFLELKQRTETGEQNLKIKYIKGVPQIVTKNEYMELFIQTYKDY